MKQEIRTTLQEMLECALEVMLDAADNQDVMVYRLETMRQYLPLLRELTELAAKTNEINF